MTQPLSCPSCTGPGHVCEPLPLPPSAERGDPAGADDVAGPFPDLTEHAFVPQDNGQRGSS